jgi:hypothetical protein
MSSSNTYGSYYLPQGVRAKLVQFQYKNELSSRSVESIKDLKEQILSGPVTIRVMDEKRFKVEISVAHFNEALCRRHYFGIRRIHRLCRGADLLASNKWATAWTLTTCYYAAFFAALELLHVTGRHVTYFSSDEIDELNTRALPSANSLLSGTYLGVAAYDASSGEVEISYGQTGQKPHDFAWHELKELVQQTKAENHDAIQHRKTLLQLLGTGVPKWSRPNEIRNRWNYVDPTLFCERGENVGAAMNERILHPKNAYRWASVKQLPVSQQNEAIGVAYIRATLVEAADRVAEAILPERLAQRRSH